MFTLDDISVTTRGYILLVLGLCLLVAGFGYFELLVHRLLLVSGAVISIFGLFQSGLVQKLTDLITSFTQKK